MVIAASEVFAKIFGYAYLQCHQMIDLRKYESIAMYKVENLATISTI